MVSEFTDNSTLVSKRKYKLPKNKICKKFYNKQNEWFCPYGGRKSLLLKS